MRQLSSPRLENAERLGGSSPRSMLVKQSNEGSAARRKLVVSRELVLRESLSQPGGAHTFQEDSDSDFPCLPSSLALHWA